MHSSPIYQAIHQAHQSLVDGLIKELDETNISFPVLELVATSLESLQQASKAAFDRDIRSLNCSSTYHDK